MIGQDRRPVRHSPVRSIKGMHNDTRLSRHSAPHGARLSMTGFCLNGIHRHWKGIRPCRSQVLVAKMKRFNLLDTIVLWMCSFFWSRCQCVNIGDVMSDRLVMDAGMPQGSYLRPLMFIVLAVSLQMLCMTNKFLADTAMLEIVARSATTYMQDCCNELLEQSQEIWMNARQRRWWWAWSWKIYCQISFSMVQQSRD